MKDFLGKDIKEGGLVLSVQSGSGRLKVAIVLETKSEKSPYSDSMWDRVEILTYGSSRSGITYPERIAAVENSFIDEDMQKTLYAEYINYKRKKENVK